MKTLNKTYLASFLGLFLALFGLDAFAAVPAIVGTSLTGVQTDALALIDLIWPVIVAITGGFILISIFKRAAGKI
jgi:Phage major coat protein, Gp8